MAKNYKHELKDSIIRNFREGIDKHALKSDGGLQGKITSYDTKFDCLDVARNFSGWMREHYPEVRRPVDTRPEMLQEFLEEKAKTCTQHTIDTYADRLKAIGKCVAAKYHTQVSWATEKVIADKSCAPDRGAGHTMTPEVRDKLLALARESKSVSAYALQMERYLGARVSDVAYGMRDQGDKMLLPNCKGGKALERPITPDLRRVLDDPKYAQYRRGQGFALPKSDSINTWMRRACDKLGLERYSFHDFRRLCAQEHYDALRNGGATKPQAMAETSEWLNHGRQRGKMMVQSYIINPW